MNECHLCFGINKLFLTFSLKVLVIVIGPAPNDVAKSPLLEPTKQTAMF